MNKLRIQDNIVAIYYKWKLSICTCTNNVNCATQVVATGSQNQYLPTLVSAKLCDLCHEDVITEQADLTQNTL